MTTPPILSASRKAVGEVTVRSVDRALRILQAFTSDEQELSLSDLGRRLELSPSTMFRLLGALQRQGFVEQNETSGKYRLGLALFKLGSLVQQGMDLRKQSDISLRRLMRKTSETSYLCVMDGDEALCIDRVEGAQQVRVLALDVGGRLPLNCGGAPRVLLAFMSDEQTETYLKRRAFARLTPHSLTQSDQLWQDIQQTRKQGYTFSVEDVIEGVAAIGAPIRDHSHQVIGAISIAGLLQHFDEDNLEAFIQSVRQEAEAISINMGWDASDGALPRVPSPAEARDGGGGVQ
jgi:DNA-binding IclR family transcriptional regulator